MTKIFILITILAITIFDVYVFSVGGTENTISWMLTNWAYDYPIFPFFMGVICGHLFWQMRLRK